MSVYCSCNLLPCYGLLEPDWHTAQKLSNLILLHSLVGGDIEVCSAGDSDFDYVWTFECKRPSSRKGKWTQAQQNKNQIIKPTLSLLSPYLVAHGVYNCDGNKKLHNQEFSHEGWLMSS